MKSNNKGNHRIPKENIKPTDPQFYEKGPMKICKSLIESFSTNNRVRPLSCTNKVSSSNNNDGSSSYHYYDHQSDQIIRTSKPIHVRLITIGPSHFCEKARWALDIAESDIHNPFYYTEDAHPPIFAGISTLKVSNGHASMTPMVVYNTKNNLNQEYDDDDDDDDDQTLNKVLIYDSSNILQHFTPNLYPPTKRNEILQLESYLGLHLGATVRVLIYHHMLQRQHYDELTKMITVHSSWIESFLWGKLLDKGLSKGMRKAMKINDESAKYSLDVVRKIFHDMSEKLKARKDVINTTSKNAYLMDTDNESFGFTAADLTFAALAGPLILPPEMASFMNIKDHQLPQALASLKNELQSTLAGQHVLEMYRKHRLLDNTSKVKGIVVPKIVGRNKVSLGISLTSMAVVLSVGACIYNKNLIRAKL